MICPRCGAESDDDSIRCNNCGIKINMYCPNCNTLNRFGNKTCDICGFELIIKCPDCGCSNIYYAQNCRKCSTPLHSPVKLPVTEEKKEESQKEITNEIDKIFTPNPILADKPILKTRNTKAENGTGTESEVLPVIKEYENEQADEEVSPLCETEDREDDETQNIIQDNDEEYEYNEDNDEYEPKSSRLPDFPPVQTNTVNKVLSLVKKSIKKHVIGLCGNEDNGKTKILTRVIENLKKDGYIVLYGSSTPLLQITAYGYFQDAFLRLLGFPPYITSLPSFKSDFQNSSAGEIFSFLDENELDVFLNLLYPNQKDSFANINDNKKQVFSILEKIIKAFLRNNNIVIIADNFELFDGASYDFINYLLDNESFNNRLKLIAAYSDNKQIQNFFDVTDIQAAMFETVVIPEYDENDLINAVSESMGLPLQEVFPQSFISELIENSEKNAVITEQTAALMFDCGYITVNDNNVKINPEAKPESKKYKLEELVKLRINSLSPNVKNILFLAAVMGYRFATDILCVSTDVPTENAEHIINFLSQELFIEKTDNYTCQFKSLELWKLIYNEAKNDLLYKENAQRLYENLKPLVLSSNIQKLISCSEALTKQESYIIWQDTASYAAKSGDTNLYVISQKQMLKLADEIEIDNGEKVKLKIYEETGKLLYKKSPGEAVTYLSNVLDEALKKSDIRKMLDVSGYFINGCYLTGNYSGVTETVDSLLSLIESSDEDISSVDIAIIKTRKLNALLNIGNCEQVINIVREEILPEIGKYTDVRMKDYKYDEITADAVIKSKIALARAYALQGNITSAFEEFDECEKLCSKRPVNKEYNIALINIARAFAHTVSGETEISSKILNKTALEYKDKALATDLLAKWNIVNILNRVLTGQIQNLKSDLFELASFTNNINEPFIKNITKLVLGYILKNEGNVKKALEIFNEEITYFAKEKIATGALAAWLLVVLMTADDKNYDKAIETATKSLEIAQSSKINSYVFAVQFQKCLGEYYLEKGDSAASKMYLEEALMTARNNGLKYDTTNLYLSFAKYLQHIMNKTQSYTSENVRLTSEMFSKALNTAKELNSAVLTEAVLKEKTEFETFCKLNSIEV